MQSKTSSSGETPSAGTPSVVNPVVRDDEEGNDLDNAVGSGYEGLSVVLRRGAMPKTTGAPFIASAPTDIVPPPVVAMLAML